MSRSSRRAKARATAALDSRSGWGDASLLIDDAQLARAAEAFLAGAREREGASESPIAAAQPMPARHEDGGATDAGILDAERVEERSADRRERSRRASPGTAPAVILDGEAWKDVVQHEAARWQRHGGSVAVLSVRLARRRSAVPMPSQSGDEGVGSGDPLAAERFALPLGDVLRHRARASDPVARVATDQFSVLLLEADEAGASAYAERIRAICEPWVTAVPGDLALRIGWAVPRIGGSIQLAAEDAFASVGSSSI